MSIIKQTSPPKERHILLREKQSWKDKSPITPTIWERAVETSTGIPCSLLRDLPDLWFRSLQLCFFSSSDHANSDLLLGPSMNGVFNNRSLTSSKAPRHRQTGKPRSTRSTQWHRDLQSSSSGQTRSCPSGSRSKSSNPQTRTKRLHSRIGGAGWSRLEEVGGVQGPILGLRLLESIQAVPGTATHHSIPTSFGNPKLSSTWELGGSAPQKVTWCITKNNTMRCR